MAFEEQNTEEHDVDAILEAAYGQPKGGIREDEPAPKAAPEPTAPQYKEYEFNHRGQAVKIKDNDPRLSQWLSQGYDYSNNISSFKTEREAWDKNRQSWEKTYSPYKEIDEFAKQNPDWWNNIERSYRSQQGQPSARADLPPEVKQYLEPMIQDYPKMKEWVQKLEAQEIQREHKAQDDQLNVSIKSIRDKYSSLDFDAKDHSGLSLEMRVLNHATQQGFPTFRAAFLDYYHDDLEKLAESRGREATMGDLQKKKKLGILDTPQPQVQSGSKSMSPPRAWDDPRLSSAAILKELNMQKGA